MVEIGSFPSHGQGHIKGCVLGVSVEKTMATHPVLLPGKSHGRRSLVACSPWGHEESDTTERLHFYSSLSCIGKGNGNPLQCSCLENPRDGGAWWAAVYGVAQSRTRLKRLSSSSSSSKHGRWSPLPLLHHTVSVFCFYFFKKICIYLAPPGLNCSV